jgi:hypothetical protein
MRHALPLLLLAACSHAPLQLHPTPVPVGYDNEEVLDVVPLDLDHDGDIDLVVATPSGLRYLARQGPVWHDETLGSALDKVGPVRALRPDGADLLIERPDGTLARLVATGIGSWHEGGAAPDRLPDPPRSTATAAPTTPSWTAAACASRCAAPTARYAMSPRRSAPPRCRCAARATRCTPQTSMATATSTCSPSAGGSWPS